MKKILILGAGIYQVPLIKKCKEKGYYTIVSSIPGDYPGFIFADKVYYENTVDKYSILDIAKKENIDAVMTTGTDVAVSSIGFVCDQLGLCGISEEAAIRSTNKAEMKRQLIDHGVRTAEFEKVFTVEEAYGFCEQIGFPVIFKCVDKSGSRGIIKVEDYNHIESAFNYSISYSDCDYIIIERFIDGHEIGVDGYYNDGNLFVVPHDKLLASNGETNIPVGHIFPYCCDKKLLTDIEEQIIMAIKALGLNRLFFNSDVMISNGQSYIIELGARCGATCIPELISLHYGIDYYGLMIDNAVGKNISFNIEPCCASVGKLLISEKNGIILDYNTQIDIRNVDEIVFDYKKGESVNKFSNGTDRIGHLIVHGKDIDSAIDTLKNAEQAVNLVIG